MQNCLLHVPMFREQEVIGAFTIWRTDACPFTEKPRKRSSQSKTCGCLANCASAIGHGSATSTSGVSQVCRDVRLRTLADRGPSNTPVAKAEPISDKKPLIDKRSLFDAVPLF